MKKVLAFLLSLVMVLSATSALALDIVPAPNAALTSTLPLAEKDGLVPDEVEMGNTEFKELGAHWATPAVKVLAANKYVQGMGDGTYMPEKNVTRAEFVTMAVNVLKLEEKAYKEGITDVSKEQWFANAIATAKENGLLPDALFTDGAFAPDSDITREDAALIIAKVAETFGAKETKMALSFTDKDKISDYAVDGVTKAFNFGLLAGYPDGSFGPKKTLTRAEASELLLRALEKGGRLAFYVDAKNGDDKNDGSKNAPVKTIKAATALVKDVNKDMKNHIFVFLKEGEHNLKEAVELGVEDSGTNGYNVVYTSFGAERAQIVSKKDFTDFKLHDKEKNIYKVHVGDYISRQVYIDGIRGVRARTDGEPLNCVQVNDFGYLCDDPDLATFKNQDDMETVTYSDWTQPRCSVDKIERTEDGKTKIIMDQPAFSSNLSGNGPYRVPHWIENAYEFINVPGEWYIDKTDGYLYYMPRAYENPETMVATIPVIDRLITVKGTAEKPVHNLVFDNLEFAYTNWMRPSSEEKGYIDTQNNWVDGGLSEGAIRINCARYIDFTNNKFSKFGAAALQLYYSIQECDIVGNEFCDLSGGGIALGWGPGDDYETEIKPKEYKYYTINNTVDNNYIHDVGVDYGSSTGFSFTWTKNTTFEHNEIANCNYSGVHGGYGWGGYAEDTATPGTGVYNTSLSYNYIHDVMNSKLVDGGGIYVFGATGGTYENPNLMTNNYIENVRNAYTAVYPDEGATFWLIEHNVIDLNDVDLWKKDGRAEPMEPRWLHIHRPSIRYNTVQNNYSTTDTMLINSPYNNVETPTVVKDGNWPQEAKGIINEAGLEQKYLEKFPAKVQRFNLDVEKWVADVGDIRKIDVTAYGRKQEVASKDDYKVTYASSDPSVVTVDENGYMKTVGAGRAFIYVNVLADGIVRYKEIEIISGDELTDIQLKFDHLKVIIGFDTELQLTAVAKYNKKVEFDSISYEFDDPTLVEVAENNTLRGLKRGETMAHITFNYAGNEYKKDVPIKVLSYGLEESANLPANALPEDFFKVENWNEGAAKLNEDGTISVTGNPSYYTKEKLSDGLYKFTLRIDGPHTWPTLALKIPDKDKNYSNSDCYMIGFKPDFIELQRFKNGERTMFMGEDGYNPVFGPGYPNNGDVFEYYKTYEIVAGTIEEENGTRIILNVDGKNIIDYLDSDMENCLRGDGYMGLYVGTGTFTFGSVK